MRVLCVSPIGVHRQMNEDSAAGGMVLSVPDPYGPPCRDGKVHTDLR